MSHPLSTMLIVTVPCEVGEFACSEGKESECMEGRLVIELNLLSVYLLLNKVIRSVHEYHFIGGNLGAVDMLHNTRLFGPYLAYETDNVS